MLWVVSYECLCSCNHCSEGGIDLLGGGRDLLGCGNFGHGGGMGSRGVLIYANICLVVDISVTVSY